MLNDAEFAKHDRVLAHERDHLMEVVGWACDLGTLYATLHLGPFANTRLVLAVIACCVKDLGHEESANRRRHVNRTIHHRLGARRNFYLTALDATYGVLGCLALVEALGCLRHAVFFEGTLELTQIILFFIIRCEILHEVHHLWECGRTTKA